MTLTFLRLQSGQSQAQGTVAAQLWKNKQIAMLALASSIAYLLPARLLKDDTTADVSPFDPHRSRSIVSHLFLSSCCSWWSELVDR